MSCKRYSIGEYEVNTSKMKLIYISTAKFEGDWHSAKHTHHFTELFYVTRGQGNFQVENDYFSVKEDDLIIVNPNIEHMEVSGGSSPLEYIVLGIEGLTFSSNIENPKHNYNFNNYRDCKNQILFYLKNLLDEVESKKVNYEIACQNLLELLLITIVRRMDYSLSVSSTKQINKESALIKRYIDSNLTGNITLEGLAELAFMNKYYLSHSFKKDIGLSPINYLIQRRIEESKDLLETSNYSIAQISNFLGFSSPSYFSQSFRKNTNQTPSQYRRSKKL